MALVIGHNLVEASGEAVSDLARPGHGQPDSQRRGQSVDRNSGETREIAAHLVKQLVPGFAEDGMRIRLQGDQSSQADGPRGTDDLNSALDQLLRARDGQSDLPSGPGIDRRHALAYSLQ